MPEEKLKFRLKTASLDELSTRHNKITKAIGQGQGGKKAPDHKMLQRLRMARDAVGAEIAKRQHNMNGREALQAGIEELLAGIDDKGGDAKAEEAVAAGATKEE